MVEPGCRLSARLLVLSLFTLAVFPQTPARAPAAPNLVYPPPRPLSLPRLEPITLSNGMRVYLVENHDTGAIHGLAVIRAGNLFDPPDRVGLAALTGMVLRSGGAAGKSPDEIDSQLEHWGGSINASIGETWGAASFSAMNDSAGAVLELFKNMLTAPDFAQERLERDRQYLRSNIAHRNDDPTALLEREFSNILYGTETPYGWPVEYTHIDRITRADLMENYRRYFFPGNVMLAVWGDFEKAAMQAQLEKLFGGWTAGQPAVPPFPKVTAEPVTASFIANRQMLQASYFAMGQLGGDQRDKDCAALEVMAAALGGGPKSRLQTTLSNRENSSSIGASWIAQFDHPGMFQVTGRLAVYTTIEGLRGVQRAIAALRTAEITEDELRYAKDLALNRQAFGYSSLDRAVERLLIYEYFGYPRDFVSQYRGALQAVTRADVLRVAKARLDPAKMTTVVVANPSSFKEPLEKFGPPVIPIDLTIPPPKPIIVTSDPASIQRGKQILERAQQAAGGVAKLAAARDYTQEVSVHLIADGTTFAETDRWVGPSHLRMEAAMPAGQLYIYCNGKTGWIANKQNSSALLGVQLRRAQTDLFHIPFTLLLSDRVPERTVLGVDDSTIEISDGNLKVRLIYDSRTWLLRNAMYQALAEAGSAEVTETYSDYRDVEGVKIPFHTSVLMGGQSYAEITVKNWQVNTGLKLADLEKRP